MKKLIYFLILIIFLLSQTMMGQGCMESTSDEGVEVIGYIQPQFGYTFLGENIEGENMDEADFYFKRARLGVVGNIPYDFSYYAIMEFSPNLNGPYLLDAFISYNRFAPYAKVSLGQFKAPFGLELTTPCHKLHTINRSQVVANLVAPWRDMGLMISGGTGDLEILGIKTKDVIQYNLAIMNGTGLNTLDNNKKKDIIGRLALKPVDFLTVGASYRFGKHPTEIQDADDDERSRFGFDLEIEYKGFLLQGEYVNGTDKGSYTIGGGCGDELQVLQGSVERQGFFAQAMYMTKWDLQPVIKIEQFDPDMAADATNDLENVITYGVNYFFNEWTRLQVNYLYKAEQSEEIKNDAILVQMQVIF